MAATLHVNYCFFQQLMMMLFSQEKTHTWASFYTQNISYILYYLIDKRMVTLIYWSGIEFWYTNLIDLYLYIVPHKTQFSDHMVTYFYSANARCFFRGKNKQTSVSFYTQNKSYISINIHLSISQYNIHCLGIKVWYINLIYFYLFIVLHKTPFQI